MAGKELGSSRGRTEMKSQKALEKGRKAFRAGNFNNPYGVKSYLRKEWERGFNEAYFENLEKVKRKENGR